MAIKYHINPETNEPNRCKAKIQCRFGEGTEHYANLAEARKGVEKKLEEETSAVRTIIRKRQTAPEQPETPLDTQTPTEDDLSRQRATERENKRKLASRLRYVATVVNKSGLQEVKRIVRNGTDASEQETILRMTDDDLVSYLEARG